LEIVIENCAPYVVTLEWDDIIGILEIEEEELTDDIISSVCQDIHDRFPKNQNDKTKDAISVDKYNIGLAKSTNTKFNWN